MDVWEMLKNDSDLLREIAPLHHCKIVRTEPADEFFKRVAVKLERYQAALEEIAEEHDAGRHDGQPESYPARSPYEMVKIAQTALLEPPTRET